MSDLRLVEIYVKCPRCDHIAGLLTLPQARKYAAGLDTPLGYKTACETCGRSFFVTVSVSLRPPCEEHEWEPVELHTPDAAFAYDRCRHCREERDRVAEDRELLS